LNLVKKVLFKSSLEAKEWYTFGIAACIPRVNEINTWRTWKGPKTFARMTVEVN